MPTHIRFYSLVQTSVFTGVNGTIHKLGTLMVNGVPKKMPTNPVCNGDLYNNRSSSSNTITIGDTNSNSAYQLQWVEINDGSDKLLICDRNLVNYISWDRLNALGLASKKGSNQKKVTIDGQEYELFMMTGGVSSSDKNDDWDRYICNGGGFSGISDSNDMWHWSSCYSWCQNAPSSDSSNRVLRGNNPASTWHTTYSSIDYTNYYVWRPCLKELN